LKGVEAPEYCGALLGGDSSKLERGERGRFKSVLSPAPKLSLKLCGGAFDLLVAAFPKSSDRGFRDNPLRRSSALSVLRAARV